MVENFSSSLIKLTDEEIEAINDLAEKKGAVRFLDPRGHIGFDIFDEERDEPVHSNNNETNGLKIGITHGTI